MKPNIVLLSLMRLMPLAALASGRDLAGYVAHEWGTFTSVQGADGVPLEWRVLESSRLPSFVYDWTHPGLDRRSSSSLAFQKGSILALQRMETPVIYFYSGASQTLDVSVAFPNGLITEWYPQAAQIGPSSAPVPADFSHADSYLQRAGFTPATDPSSFSNSTTLHESRIHWTGIKLLSAKAIPPPLARDSSASHYFAARETDAAFLQADSLLATNPQPEIEKFLFYRGVGNFTTPLRATLASDDTLTLGNTETESLRHLFLLRVENGTVSWAPLKQIPGKGLRRVPMLAAGKPSACRENQDSLSRAVADALVAEGLYPREAAAMVNTWKDSWFAEDGVRVLYLLPRPWTDQTLPISFRPQPRSLVRVMVGRAELLTPTSIKHLARVAADAGRNQPAAHEQLVTELRKRGRFAEPALRLATQGLDASNTSIAWNALPEAAGPQSSTP